MNVRTQGQPFKFFVPFEMSKAKDEQGREVMKIGGIASTSDEDSDGEFLDPQGFDLDYFLKYGFLNWHHQAKNNPSAIVGEPTLAEIRDRKLYIEGELYNESPLARDIYTLADSLKKSGSKRRLGFSIEGSVLERDPMNEKIVKKARITGCAITPTPKNSNTLADIVKGEGVDIENYEYEMQENPNGGTELIVDVVRPTGEHIMVDSNFNITIKALSAGGNGAPLVRASVDGQVKDLQKVGQNHMQVLTKGEVYGQIFDYLHDDIEKAQQVFTLIEQISKSQNNSVMSITQESIDKAFEVLGLSKSIETSVGDDITKAMDGEGKQDSVTDYEENGKEKDAETKANVEKAEGGSDEEEDEEDDVPNGNDMTDDDYDNMKKAYDSMCKKTERMKKSMSMYETKKAKMSEKVEKGEGEGNDNLEKANEFEALKIFGGLEELIKAQGAEMAEKINATSIVLEKAMSTVASLDERLGAIENQSVGRRSVTTQSFIEKGFDNSNDKNSDVTVLSRSRNKAQILDVLEARAEFTEKGFNNAAFANAMGLFESSGVIDTTITNRLLVDNKIRIVD